MSPARRGKVWWSLGAFVALAVLIIAYVSGSCPWAKPRKRRRPCAGSPPRTPITLKKPRVRTRKATTWCRSIPPRPARSPAARPRGAPAPAEKAEAQDQAIGVCPMHPKSSGISPANARYAAWTWCRSMKKLPAAAPAGALPLPRPPAPPKSARSSTGSRPWTRATSGISRARPPAAWTWCRFMKKRGRGRRRRRHCRLPHHHPVHGRQDRQDGGPAPDP